MTLVVCAYMEDKLTCLSDTRISSGGSTILDSGAKLFIIPVTTKYIDTDNSSKTHSYSLGFAFCGSTLVATNTHAIASNCTQILFTAVADSFPSALDVANIYSKAAEYVMRDMRTKIDEKNLNGIIFGHCPVENRYRLFLIYPYITNVEFRIEVQEIDIVIGAVFSMGSGKEEFARLLKIPNSAGNERSVLEVFTQVLNEDSVNDVGGHPQILEAQRDRVIIVPVLAQDPFNLDETIVTVNGFNTSDIGLPKHFGFGSQVWGIGIEKIGGRYALREAGLDPDDGPIPLERQNLASMSFTVKHAFKENKKIQVNDNYTLEKVLPTAGTWYFYGRCMECRRKTPRFKDPSLGKSNSIFRGNGSIKSKCFYCDSIVNVKAVSLKSYQWR